MYNVYIYIYIYIYITTKLLNFLFSFSPMIDLCSHETVRSYVWFMSFYQKSP